MNSLDLKVGDCIIPRAVGDADYAETGGPRYDAHDAHFVINGPPDDGRCESCGRHVSELEAFDLPPHLGLQGVKLMAAWRDEFAGRSGTSWECRECISR